MQEERGVLSGENFLIHLLLSSIWKIIFIRNKLREEGVCTNQTFFQAFIVVVVVVVATPSYEVMYCF